MDAMANCPRCGAPLPADAPAGLCPACLARAARPAAASLDPEALAEVRRTLVLHAPDLELGELIGRGGMGFVFRGRQARLGREVAVKVLDPELSRNALFAERFSREAQTLARLAHPSIVAVHDYGQAGELFYLVLEYVDGVNLRQILQARTLLPPQALAIVPQVCEALEFAHSHGVVHRDVKPENILIDRLGRVKIADFGLAKLLGFDAQPEGLTSAGQVLGTLRYMAPEQMERPLEVDHRADIYSLGVVFYEMLTGEIPMGRFAPPSHKVRIDVQLDEVVLRTLEREPELRYQHASDVKDDVETIGAGGRVRARGAERPGMRRLSWLAVSAPALALGVPLVAMSFLVFEMLRRSGLEDGLRVEGLEPGPRPVGIEYYYLGAMVSFLGLAAGSALGWAAVERIRAHWPRLYGLGAALTGVWLLPLYALGTALLAGTSLGLAALGVALTPWALGLEAAALLALAASWVARRRRRMLQELEPEPAAA